MPLIADSFLAANAQTWEIAFVLSEWREGRWSSCWQSSGGGGREGQERSLFAFILRERGVRAPGHLLAVQ